MVALQNKLADGITISQRKKKNLLFPNSLQKLMSLLTISEETNLKNKQKMSV